MGTLQDSYWGSKDFANSNVLLTDPINRSIITEKSKEVLRKLKYFVHETTVEPCLFIYMMCTAISSFAVQNMHLEKSCRVNFDYGDDICDRIRDRNTTGLDTQLDNIQSVVAKVIAWKFPLQTGIPAVLVLFIGAWSDKTKKRKICIICPMVGEIVTNIGLLFATYYFRELSLTATVLIEALPPALTGSYIIIFMGMYSFMADRTSVEDRTFRLGIVAIFVNLGTPLGTALSGILLRALGYYGIFTLLLVLHCSSFLYGLFKLEDGVQSNENEHDSSDVSKSKLVKLREVLFLVGHTVLVAVKPRLYNQRTQILVVLVLYVIMVGPLYGDSQVAYLYAIKKFGLTEVEYSIYGTIGVLLGLVGMVLCISVLSKRLSVEDSIIGVLAGMSRIASCFVTAFAPNRKWYYSAPVFNIFGNTGLTAIRSIATKTVPTEEVAKLSSLIGVMEAIAPSVYTPTSSYIYVSTINTFPGAFYMFDAALTVVALALFIFIFMIQKRQRNKTENSTRNKQEGNPTKKEISRL